jgi:hypothetical protein
LGSFTPAKYRLGMKIYFRPHLIYLLDNGDLFNIIVRDRLQTHETSHGACETH